MAPLKGKREYIIPHGVANITSPEFLSFTQIQKSKQKHPAIGPQQSTSIMRLKLHSVQVNLLALATKELAHQLNCKAQPQPRELRANLGSHSLG